MYGYICLSKFSIGLYMNISIDIVCISIDAVVINTLVKQKEITKPNNKSNSCSARGRLFCRDQIERMLKTIFVGQLFQLKTLE